VESDARVILARVVLSAGLVTALQHAAAAQDWAARFPPAPQCQPELRPSAALDSTLQIVGRARLIVVLRVFDPGNNVSYVRAALTPLARPLQPTARTVTRDTAHYRVVEADTSGPHLLSLSGIGYSGFVDTVTPRIGYSDTIVVWLRDAEADYRNTYNCRPRGFRQAGESACVTEPVETEAVLMRAREFAGQGSLKSLGIAPFDSSRVSLIQDEKTCRRAAKLYGEPNDPPRRVVVVRMGKHYLVYDPYEPMPAGEWNIWRVFDRRWRPVFDLMG
jgi:hypothetical protein